MCKYYIFKTKDDSYIEKCDYTGKDTICGGCEILCECGKYQEEEDFMGLMEFMSDIYRRQKEVRGWISV